MPWVDLGDGLSAHICVRGRPARRCTFCNTGWVDKLCDFPVGPSGKTCDKGMCHRCATAIAPEVDYCPNHKAQQPAQGALAL